MFVSLANIYLTSRAMFYFSVLDDCIYASVLNVYVFLVYFVRSDADLFSFEAARVWLLAPYNVPGCKPATVLQQAFFHLTYIYIYCTHTLNTSFSLN